MFMLGICFQIVLMELKSLMRINFFIERNEQYFVFGISVAARRAFFLINELCTRIHQSVEFVERADLLPV